MPFVSLSFDERHAMLSGSPLVLHLEQDSPIDMRRVGSRLLAEGFRVGVSACSILNACGGTLPIVNECLYSVSVADIALSEGAAYPEICTCALGAGWGLSPMAYAALSRLQYIDQPLDDSLLVASEPLQDQDGVVSILELDRAFDGLWLRAFDAGSRSYFGPKTRFLFRRAGETVQ
jgi:hypothetical protein